MIEVIGIIGGLLFAAGCVPLARATWKAGKDLGTPLSTQWLLFLACIMYSVFLIGAFGADHVAFWFLVIEVVSWGIVLWFHYFPRAVGGPTRQEIRNIAAGRAKYNMDGPCTPQCHAECDGVCSAEMKRACPHNNVPNANADGSAWCHDCGGLLPDCLPKEPG